MRIEYGAEDEDDVPRIGFSKEPFVKDLSHERTHFGQSSCRGLNCSAATVSQEKRVKVSLQALHVSRPIPKKSAMY